jgi:glucose/arabinose dehydrogenase
VKVLDLATNSHSPQLFLDISAITETSWLEWGLLGMCFDPDYANNGHIYLNYISKAPNQGDTNIVRYTRSATQPDRIDPATRTVLLFLDQPSQNHRGGWLGFGPDGFLYFTLGDGGGQQDPSNRAQNVALLQGKMLRIDPHGVDAYPADANKNYAIPADNPFVGLAGHAPEIWAYGLRNPWRCSFDRLTGDLWIGDVGQYAREEVDFQPALTAENHAQVAGRNYGWRCTEGTSCTGLSGCTCNGAALTPPLFEYGHASGPAIYGLSVTGGFVYRGCALPAWRGVYFFGDYQVARLYTLTIERDEWQAANITTMLDPPGTQSIGTAASFGEDALGEIYIVDYSDGEVYKIIAAGGIVGPDCNTNGRDDACDIAAGSSTDADMNGVPDECEELCAADFDGSGGADVPDIFAFLSAWFAMDASAEFDGVEGIAVPDIFAFLSLWFAGC